MIFPFLEILSDHVTRGFFDRRAVCYVSLFTSGNTLLIKILSSEEEEVSLILTADKEQVY